MSSVRSPGSCARTTVVELRVAQQVHMKFISHTLFVFNRDSFNVCTVKVRTNVRLHLVSMQNMKTMTALLLRRARPATHRIALQNLAAFVEVVPKVLIMWLSSASMTAAADVVMPAVAAAVMLAACMMCM